MTYRKWEQPILLLHSCADCPDVDKFIDLQSTKSYDDLSEGIELLSDEDDEGNDDSGSKRKGKRKQGKEARCEEHEDDQVCFNVFSCFGADHHLSA